MRKKMKLPERIKIISKRYSIDWVDEGKSGLSPDEMGECDILHQKILMERGLAYDTQKVILLHEVLHAVSDEMLADELSEEQVTGMAKGILAVLMDNPSFARFLLRKETKQIQNKKELNNDGAQTI